MNIGFDAKRAFFNRSGLGNYSRSTMDVLASNFPENKYYLYTPARNSSLYTPAENQTVIRPENGIYSAIPSIWRSFGIGNSLKKNKIDVFHGLSNELPISIRSSGAKSVVTIHDLIFLQFPEYYPLIDRKIYEFKFRNACRNAESIIAISEATKSDLMRYFKIEDSKIEVVYQTCNPVFKNIVPEENRETIRGQYNLPQNYILYLGTIEKRKNALTLVKAFLKKDLGVHLVVAGRPTSYLDEIKEYIKDKPLSGKISFQHSIKSEDLPALYQMASVFVYPSVIEGFGIPILEALNSGIPVITSTGSCFSETGGNAAMYCEPYDSENMALIIDKVITNNQLRANMIQEGYIHAARFNEEIVAENIMNVYKKISS